MKATEKSAGLRQVLLCPGPVMMSAAVATALAECTVGHRDPRFSRLVERVRTNCAAVLGAGESRSVMFVTGPATVGLEAMFGTLCPPDRPVIVPVNGTFGARLVDILSTLSISCLPVDFGFGMPFDLQALEQVIASAAADGASTVAMTHHETSAGLLNPVRQVAEIGRRYGLTTFVDATSSAGAEDLDLEREGIDACITTSGKCLHAPPGIAIAVVRRELLGSSALPRARSYALDLRRYHEQLEANLQTPFTAAVQLLAALDRAVIELIESGGVAARRQHYRRRRAILEAGARRIGLPLLELPAGCEASSILTVGLPDGMDFAKLQEAVRADGFVIYAAKPPLTDRFFQVGVMGELEDSDLVRFVGVLESLLLERVSLDRAVTARYA